MEAQATRIFDGRKVELRETEQYLTPYGGLVVFLEFLNRIGLVRKVMECMPVVHRSPNSIPPAQTWVAFLISVVAGRGASRTPVGCGATAPCTRCSAWIGSRAMTRSAICFCGSGWVRRRNSRPDDVRLDAAIG